MEIERRIIEGLDIEIREDGTTSISGLGIVFNSWSVDMGFFEMVEPDAVRGLDFNGVVSLFNHREDNILGRVPDTMSLKIEESGLRYTVELPVTSVGEIVREGVKRKDIRGSSFGFTIEEEAWRKRDDGKWERRILKLKRLYDVSPVVFPAYPATTVAMRSLDSVIQSEQKIAESRRRHYFMKKEVEILKLK